MVTEDTSGDAPDPVASEPGKPAAGDVLKQLGQDYAVFREARPLAIGIHKELLQRQPALGAPAVRAAMRRHTASTRYLKAVATGDDRFDLDGKPAGKITEEQKQQAAEALRERFKKGAERKREEVKAKQDQERAAARERQHQEKLQALAEKFKKR